MAATFEDVYEIHRHATSERGTQGFDRRGTSVSGAVQHDCGLRKVDGELQFAGPDQVGAQGRLEGHS